MVEIIERGYESIVDKLQAIGAHVQRVDSRIEPQFCQGSSQPLRHEIEVPRGKILSLLLVQSFVNSY